jgi:3-hydroxyisobutyrate dehydrogenase-like beta-hydroxyacid dehydrogenase
VVSSVAVDVARDAAPHLEPRHTYVDLNSTSPGTKQEVGRIVGSTGAQFVEAAVMAAVPPLAHKVPLLMCGDAVPGLISRLSRYDMSLEDFGPEIGRATATKMFRSIMVKGLEALFLECALGASKYGVTDRVLESVGVGYPGLDWNKLAHYLIGRTALHGERRGHEMMEVAATLRGLNVDPIMADAAARRILYCAGLGLKSKFAGKAPENYHDVIAAIEEAERK